MLSNKPGYPPPTIRLLRIQVPRWERNHRGILRWWWRVTGWGKLKKKSSLIEWWTKVAFSLTHYVISICYINCQGDCFMNYVITHFMIMFTNAKPPSNPSDPTTIQCLLSQGLLQQEPLEGPKSGVKRFVRFGKNAGFQPLMLHVYIYILIYTIYSISHKSLCVCVLFGF